ncbi:MAG TPA: hypothetical protein VMX15_00065 [Candidatus Heimdallarchaeota archaeon]|nr:hypothetical protein [Candidatus Heimdallarchaeota archaeon]
MPRPVMRDGQEDFSGGLNLAADESRLARNELRRADNARLTEFGGVTHRGGTQRVSPFHLSGYNTTILGTNLIDNPSMNANADGWATYISTAIVRDTGTPYSGSAASAKVTTQASFRSGAAIFADASDTRWTVTPGETYIYTIEVYGTGGAIGAAFYLDVFYYAAGGTGAGVTTAIDQGGTTAVTLAAGWNVITRAGIVPAGVTSAHFVCATDDLAIYDVWMGGASATLAPEAPVQGGYFWLRPNSTDQVLAVMAGTLYTGTYAVPMTWTQQTGVLDSTVQPTLATFRDVSADVVYIADGGALNKWDGTTLSINLASTPNVSIIAVYNNRLYGCGDPSNPYRLYWSALQNGDTLGQVGSGGGFADIRTFAQSELTGLQPLGAGLLIFHRNGISRFTGIGIDDIDIQAGTRGVSSDVGTFSPHAIVALENVCLFLSDRGIFQCTEEGMTAVAERPGGGVNSIGDRIETVLRTVNQATLARAIAAHNKQYHEVLFYLPDVGVYAFNYRLGAWSGPWNGIYSDSPTYSMWPIMNASEAPSVLFGSADGHVRLVDAPSLFKDDYLSDGTGGVVNTMVFQCRRFDFKTPTIEKAYRWIFLTLNPRGTVTGGVNWTTVDTAGSQTIILTAQPIFWDAPGATWDDTLVWSSSGGGTSVPTRVQAHGSGTFIEITITDDSATGALYSRVEAHGFLMGERY